LSKKALLTVSFGTSYTASRERAIIPMETTLAGAFPGHDHERAMLSHMVISKINRRDGLAVENPGQALERLYQSGYQEILIQPLLVMAGIEYERLLTDLRPWQNRFERLSIGSPLLAAPEDYEKVADVLENEFRAHDREEAFILMGHGSRHRANAVYAALEAVFRVRGWPKVYIATVEGRPTFADILPRLRENHVQKVALMPFMLVAGDHAHNDMAGEDEESWKTILEREGFAVSVHMAGLGEIEGIRKIFVAHAQAACENEHP